MKIIKRTKILMVAFLVAAFFVAGIPFGEQSKGVAFAQTFSAAPKLSLDLHQVISSAPDKPVRVIIDMAPSLKNKAYANLLSALSEKGGIITRSLNGGQTAAVMIPAGALNALANDTAIRYISLDRDTQVAGHLETSSGAALARNLGTTATGTIDGRNIGIAILDSGIYAAHHAFLTNRIVASVDFTGEGRTDDPYGHGTHVASIAAGNSHICNGAYTGIAPAAKIINVRVLNSQGAGSLSNAIAGIDWCIANKAAYNIRVINMSFGSTAIDSYVNDPLCQAARRAFNAGIIVCAAAGNSGKNASGSKIYGAIHSPGIDPSVITVGASNTYGTNSRADDSLCSYSSSGPTRGYTMTASGSKRYDNLIKPDLVAPGNKIIGAESPNNRILSITPSLDANISISAVHKMMTMSGTSMATPAVSGAVALILQRNPNLTPNLVKAILEYSAQPLRNCSNYQQGAGELNVEGAVRLAGLIRTDLTGRLLGDPLLTGAAPIASSTIGGSTFQWGSGLVQKWNTIYGGDLLSKYQGIYGTGVVLSDGVLISNGTLLAAGTLLCSGTLLSAGVLISDGTLLSAGTLLTAGALLSDGVLMSDGVLLSDGVLMSDSVYASSMPIPVATALAMSALDGDLTACMPPEIDLDPLN